MTTRCSCTRANTTTWTTPRRIWGTSRNSTASISWAPTTLPSLTKNEKGKVKIVDKTEKPTQHGGWAGLAVGAAVGLIFPPSILVSGAIGAGAGALIGHLRGGMSDSDLKEVGEMLDESEAALIVVGEVTVERAVEEATKRAKKEMKKEVRADAKEMEKAIDEA